MPMRALPACPIRLPVWARPWARATGRASAACLRLRSAPRSRPAASRTPSSRRWLPARRISSTCVARKIREVAGEHDIPIVENPPLARALHATVDVDQEIPPEHYQAVAEVIGYVMRLNRAVAGRRQ